MIIEVGMVLADIFIPEGNGWIKITVSELRQTVQLFCVGTIEQFSEPVKCK